MGKGREGYSFPINQLPDISKIALARGYELPIKWKHAREIANAIMEKGMMLKEAIEYLERVAKLEKPVPFKRFKGNVGHRKGMHEFKWPAGRYPQKAARYLLKVLRNALNNARQKNLNEDRLKIIWFATHKSRKLRRRADRRGPGIFRGWMVKTGVNVEVIVMELPEEELEEAIRETEEATVERILEETAVEEEEEERISEIAEEEGEEEHIELLSEEEGSEEVLSESEEELKEEVEETNEGE